MRQKVKVTDLVSNQTKEITFFYRGRNYTAEYNGEKYVEEEPGTEVIFNGVAKKVVRNVHVIFVDGIGFTIYKAGIGELKISPEKGYKIDHYMFKRFLIYFAVGLLITTILLLIAFL